MTTHALLNDLPHPARLVDVETAMATLSISRPSLYKMFSNGTLQSVLIGRCRRIPTRELDRVMAGVRLHPKKMTPKSKAGRDAR